MNNRYFFPSLSDPSGFPATQYELQEACISLMLAGKNGKSGNEETEIFLPVPSLLPDFLLCIKHPIERHYKKTVRREVIQ